MRADRAAGVVQREARWFEPTADGMGPLLDAIGNAGLVLIGEATHGTHEFYRTRAELTKALISRKGFNVVAVEADSGKRAWAIRYASRAVRLVVTGVSPSSSGLPPTLGATGRCRHRQHHGNPMQC